MFPFRTVVLGAFVPTLLFEIGIGALLPVIPALTTGTRANLPTAALIAALIPIGQILFDIPAGALAAGLGDRLALMTAGVIAVSAFVLIATTESTLGLAAGVFTLGGAASVYNLARQTYLTEITPPLHRARVMSTLAGFHRIGLFIGPFLGAGVIALFSVSAVTWLGVGAAAASVIVLASLGSDPSARSKSLRRQDEFSADRSADQPAAPTAAIAPNGTAINVSAPAAPNAAALDAAVPTVAVPPTFNAAAPTAAEVAHTVGMGAWQLAVHYRGLFLRLGVAVLLVSAARGSRQTIVPLWAEHIGLHEGTTSLIVGIAGGLDMLLFYPAGKVMDRRGRLWIAVPSMLLMAIGTALIPLTQAALSLGIVAAVLGIANGIGSGIVMTLGADVAPPDNRARFLSVWRLFQDTGGASGPLLLSAGAAIGSLAAGAWVAAAVGALAAAALARWAPRYSPLANLRPRRK